MTKSSLPLSVAVGALLVPLVAVASVVIVRPSEEASALPTPATTVPVAASSTDGALADDLVAACGPAGLQLVEAERDGSATQIQQAALDALRPVCDALGMSLPAPDREQLSEAVAPAPPAPESRVVTSVIPEDHDDDHGDRDDDGYEYEYEDGEWEVDD